MAVEQAGAVVFRLGKRLKVLIVTSRKEPSHWIFPKGHIEPGESGKEAALREAEEEAGAVGEIIGPALGTVEFSSGTDDVRVRYYPVKLTHEVRCSELREIRWVDPADALKTLTHDTTRELLQRALGFLASHGIRG